MNNRWVQKDGEVNITRLSHPIQILDTPFAKVSISMYSNNEPHLHLTEIKRLSSDAIKYAKIGIEEIKKKFNSLGYDKIYTLIKDTDTQSKRLMLLLGFEPKIIYEDVVGVKFIKHEMETK